MEKRIKKVILPAAGLGTRFLPATKASPKEMLPIVDKPLIQYAVEEAINAGMEEFIIITGKNKRTIEDHFDAAYRLEEKLKSSGKDKLLEEIQKLNDVHFAYIRQKTALGLGHAIGCASPFVNNEPFAVILSDDVIDPEYPLLEEMAKIFYEKDAPVIALQEVPKNEVNRYGIIKGFKEGDIYRIEDLVEKPSIQKAPSNLAIIGRYILTPDIFQILQNLTPGAGGEIQLTDALKKLLKKRPIYGYLIKGERYDAGDKLGFIKATIDLALKNNELSEGLKEYIIKKARSIK
ncbi:MAG TPA: UTP--glucose-1-phosphate uridylyltransferase GalU [Nitrospirae bacterium]|nr:UTP--glucose-1-phosphate uridylyltransferase GalU [Nitrospirota bacterium]